MSCGSIYCLTCETTGLKYIGQATDVKFKSGKPYSYGVTGRWNDHVSSHSTTPLNRAIQEHGQDAFTIETLEADVPDERLDEREAHWISELNTVVPNGYNKMRHSRCRHRESTSLSAFYAPITESCVARQVKKNGDPHLIHLYLHLKDDKGDVRLVFGQGKDSSYDKADAEFKLFISGFESVPIEMDPRIIDTTVSKYEEKLMRFDGIEISKIRIAKFNTLAAVYIDKTRICFGGKSSTFEQAVEIAKNFAEELLNRHPEAIIVNSIK